MAVTKLIAHGFLGYEVVIDGSVQAHVLFGLRDEKNDLLAWYGFRETPSPWHTHQFDAFMFGNTTSPDLTANTRFASGVDFVGHQFTHPGRLSVTDLIYSSGRSGVAVQADLKLHDRGDRTTNCFLSVPAVRPMAVNLSFRLAPTRKRYTFDHTMNGVIDLIVVVPFTHDALVSGPRPQFLIDKMFRVPSADAKRKKV